MNIEITDHQIESLRSASYTLPDHPMRRCTCGGLRDIESWANDPTTPDDLTIFWVCRACHTVKRQFYRYFANG